MNSQSSKGVKKAVLKAQSSVDRAFEEGQIQFFGKDAIEDNDEDSNEEEKIPEDDVLKKDDYIYLKSESVFL